MLRALRLYRRGPTRFWPTRLDPYRGSDGRFAHQATEEWTLVGTISGGLELTFKEEVLKQCKAVEETLR